MHTNTCCHTDDGSDSAETDSVVSTVEVASSLSGQPYTAMKIDKDRWVGYTAVMRNRCSPTRRTIAMLAVLHNVLCTLVRNSMLAWLVNR